MALPPSTANWHWKNKNVTQWGTDWIQRELKDLTVNGDGKEDVITITKVEADGDVELGQRKSKLITIFDCKVNITWTGAGADGLQVKGKLTIPEVSHEIVCDGLSEFVYNWDLRTDPSPKVLELYDVAKSRLPSAIEAKISKFPAAIIDTHGKDLTVSADPSRSGTPAPPSIPAPSVPAASTSVPQTQGIKPSKKKSVNTTTVTVDANFQASADDLYGLLTEQQKISMWTRAPAQSTGEVGSEYSLFGGGVKGKFVSLSRPTEIVQTWSLQSPTWPTGKYKFIEVHGHEGKLTTTLSQSSDSTRVSFSLAGVPLGIEDEIKKNIEGYYIHGFKSIGYVLLVQDDTVYPVRNVRKSEPRPNEPSIYIPAIIIGALVLLAAFSIPFLSSSPRLQ